MTSKTRITSGLLIVVGLVSLAAAAQDPRTIRILFVSKSSGYEHSSIRQSDGEPSHVDRVLRRLAGANGMELFTTKDASLINAKELESFNVVLFYTTGDLTQAGKGKGIFQGDGNPPMGKNGLRDLLRWIENGGGFVGYHPATDTFHGSEDAVTPYIDMIGGEFKTHGQQFKGTVRIVDPDHPTMEQVPALWPMLDEWYLFKNFNRQSLHVLALLDPGEERHRQRIYDGPDYPVIWCRSLGQGRVYYNAMGHREEVWDDPTFQQSVLNAIRWAKGVGEARSAPNFERVVPDGGP